jgi:receptor-type tyrosine-protein phosphatase gamma
MTLREAPRGKPLIVRVQNLSASSVVVSWRPPDNDTIHGEFLGYRLNWRPRDATDNDGPEVCANRCIPESGFPRGVVCEELLREWD